MKIDIVSLVTQTIISFTTMIGSWIYRFSFTFGIFLSLIEIKSIVLPPISIQKRGPFLQEQFKFYRGSVIFFLYRYVNPYVWHHYTSTFQNMYFNGIPHTEGKILVMITVPKMTHFEEWIWLSYRQDSH